jgi:hypothetical protein
MRVPHGETGRYVYFVAVDSTDLKTRQTGLTGFTVYQSRDGEAAASFTTPTVNETDNTNMSGVYELLLDEGTTMSTGNASEELCLHITQPSMAPVTRAVELYRDSTRPMKNQAFSDVYVFMVASTDHVTAKTGLTLSVTRSIDGGAFAAGTGSAAEIGNGMYQYDASAADMNGSMISFRFTGDDADDTYVVVRTSE